MLSDKARSALLDIRENIAAAQSFLEGASFETFRSDLKTFYAVTRALEIISEASRRLPDEFKACNSAVAWRAIRDAGNFYRHSYERVEVPFIWDTAHDDLVQLSKVVEAELAAPESGDPQV